MNGTHLMRTLRLGFKQTTNKWYLNQNGIALLLVLWVLVLLSIIVSEFCLITKTELNITRNFKGQTLEYYIAEAGINRAVYELIANRNIWPADAKDHQPKDDDASEMIRFRINAVIPPISFGEGNFQVWIDNESGKVNINRAGVRLLKMMLTRFQLDEETTNVIVDSIMDWRDKNNLHRINGAEDDYYQALDEPYDCKDAPFDSIEELLLVRGITEEIYWGGLKDIVTVLSSENENKNEDEGDEDSYDYNKININAANSNMLYSLPMMTEDSVSAIIQYREEKDIKGLHELIGLLGGDIYANISSYLTVKYLPYYTITSHGRLDGVSSAVRIVATVSIDEGNEAEYRLLKWNDQPDIQLFNELVF